MMKVLSKDIKEFTKEWKTTIKQGIQKTGLTPMLGILQVGEDMVFQDVWQAANINLDDHVRREQKLFSCKNPDDPQCSIFCPQFDHCKEKEKENK